MHFIVNNQIGFTTYPRYSRSSPYPSDVAKMIEAPIFHVNGDDPEAVVYAAKVATEFRQKFQQAGRHRHVLLPPPRPQRGDEPAFTQPLMYKAIARASDHAGNLRQEADRRGRDHRGRSREDEGRLAHPARSRARGRRKATSRTRPTGSTAAGPASRPPASADDAAPRQHRRRRSTELQRDRQEDHHGAAGLQRAQDHPALPRQRAAKRSRPARASTGRPPRRSPSARCSSEGHPVRLSGQDSERGTFSQRHSVLIDQETEERYTPLNHLGASRRATRSSIRCSRKKRCSASNTAIRSPSRRR